MWKMAVDRKPLPQLWLRIKKICSQNPSLWHFYIIHLFPNTLISDKPPIIYKKATRGIPKGIWTRPKGRDQKAFGNNGSLRRLKTKFSCRKVIQAENEPMSATTSSCGITNYGSYLKNACRWLRELTVKERTNL